ncbi:hypothetical protein ACNOYE_25940 [Nannocystaceae bacterium ST9]
MQYAPPDTVLASLLTALLFADPELDAIAWSGEHVCPGAAQELAEAIDEQIGGPPAGGEPLTIAIRLEPSQGAGPRLELSIASKIGSERHELHAESCAAVIDQAALLVASARDPFVFVWTPASPPGGPQPGDPRVRPPIQRPRARSSEAPAIDRPAPLEPPDPPTIEPDPPAIERPLVDRGESPSPSEPAIERPVRRRGPRPPVTGAIGAAATGFVGLFPSIGGGAELEGALERGAFRWQLAGSGWFGGRFRANDGTIGGDLWALGLGTGLCGVPLATRRVRLPLCAGAGAGLVVADAVGTLAARRSTQAWAWLGAEARVQVLVTPRFALGLGVGVQVSLVRPGWSVSSPDAEFRLRPITGILRLSGEFRGLARNSRSSSISPRARGQ